MTIAKSVECQSVVWKLCIVFIFILDFVATKNQTLFVQSPLECGSVFLTVSSLKDANLTRSKNDRLELNWDVSNCNGSDPNHIPNRVAIFRADPATGCSPLESVSIRDFPWDYYVSKVTLGQLQLPGEWNKRSSIKRSYKKKIDSSGAICLPFWIGSFHDDQLLKVNCLKIQPTWMADTREFINDAHLSRLILPGAHNSGSFAFPGPVQGILDRWVLCQDRDVWTQLVFGIRYLDFRIAYYETFVSILLQEDSFWLNHNMVKVTPLIPLLKDIRRFLDSTTDEIIILDIHQLPVGFPDSNGSIPAQHQRLLSLLKQEFQDHILEFGDGMAQLPSGVTIGPTVGEILAKKRRLIIGYPDQFVVSQNKWLWPNVRHMWGNTNNPYKLKTYLDGVMAKPYRPTSSRSNPLWSAMAQTTPTAMEIVLDPGSLRKNANAINRNVTKWLTYQWWSAANIVSTDYFLGNNVIDLAVYFNKFKGVIMKSTLGKIFFF